MEKKKLLLVSVSVGLFLIIVIGVSILAFSPKGYSAFESVRAQAAENDSGAIRVASPEQISETPPPVPSISSGQIPQINEVPPPAPVSAESQTPQAPQKENVIYINGENAENAVKVERLVDGNTRTYITFPNASAPQITQTQSQTQSQVAPPVPVTAQATAAVEVRTLPGGQVQQVTQSSVPNGASQNGVREVQTTAAPAVKQSAVSQSGAKEVRTTAPPLAVAKKPVVKAKSAPAVSSGKATPRRSDYWVQTGSFTTKSRADEASGFLALKGITSIVQDTNVQGKVFYRVRVGPYTTQNEANYWLALVKTIDGMENSLVWKAN
ncbi:MAG: hypothetical protein Pg6A_14820 [Termitinemataceae bacterium]|nr:MAG: hypothetical protein Pg6A_14820 [Termitinemataceae bacterium]